MNDEEQINPEVIPPLESHLFSPRNLKIIAFSVILFILFIIITIYIVIKTLDRRPLDAFFWYENIERIKFTSYEEPSYGTFFCSVKVNLAYQNKNVVKEIEQKKNQIINTIRQSISEQNYYRINNNIKMQYNLTPTLKKRINNLLINPSGIKDINYPFIRLMLNKNNTSNKFSYLDLSTFNININNKQYEAQIYIVYDPSSNLFNKYLKEKRTHITKLISSFINKQNIEPYLFQDKIKPMLNSKIEEYFSNVEAEIKRKNPYYSITGHFKNLFFAYFVPITN